MKHKIIQSLTAITALLVVLLMPSCQKGFEPQNLEDAATLKIGIATRNSSTKATSDEALLGGAEYAIKSLRIFVFKADGTLEKVDVKNYPNPITYSVVYEIEVPKKDPQKQLYVIVNEPEGAFDDLSTIETVSDLKDIEFTFADALNSGFNAAADFNTSSFSIPMTGEATIDASHDMDVTIYVARAVARVDLMLEKSLEADEHVIKLNSNTEFKVNGVTIGAKLFAPDALATVGSSDIEPEMSLLSSELHVPTYTSEHTNAERVLSFYLAERNYNTNDSETNVEIKVSSVELDGQEVAVQNSIVLGKGATTELTQIKRNHVYRIYAKYNGALPTITPDEFVVIKDWTEVELDGEIEGVTMAVDNIVAMDWLRNGNSFKSPNAAFNSNKPIEVFLPVVTGVDANGAITTEFKEYEFPSMKSGDSYDLKTLSLDNSLLDELEWITDARITFTSRKEGYYTGYVSITYSPMSTTYDKQSYPIRFKSDNVVKQMKVVYDNGYIPKDFLPAHWQERAPGGVVFAKRGEAKHPALVDEIIYPDSEGYFVGEHSLVQADAKNYCESLGADWYFPSKEDLGAMLVGVKELGTSYRFQDTPGSYYWTTSAGATTGMFWCGNFEYYEGTLTQESEIVKYIVERNATETNFVRCMLDIK